MSAQRPFFSIILPVYNRADLVTRTLRSCTSQSFTDFEIVVVDDASRDDSAAVVRAYGDPRIRLLIHEKNRGVGPARNTAMAAARGEWFVFLDSDDELLPGALEAMHRRAVAAPESVVVLRFMCRDEHGTSPDPPHHDEILDYEGYIRWIEAVFCRRQEALPCVRSSTNPDVRYADSRAREMSYHLQLAGRGLVQMCSEVVRRYHHDAHDRLTIATPEKSLLEAADLADDADRVLAAHGDALRRWAPHVYRTVVGGAASLSFMAGRRWAGLRYSIRAFRLMPFSPRTWVVAFVGLLGRRPLAQLQAWRAQSLRAAQ